MKTACGMIYRGPGRIVISRGTRRMAAGFKHYLKLAPTAEILAMAYTDDFDADDPKDIKALHDRFEAECLKQLNAEEIYRELQSIVPQGVEPILVCYEKPGEPCHRRRVADWFERKLGLKVPEMAVSLQQRG